MRLVYSEALPPATQLSSCPLLLTLRMMYSTFGRACVGIGCDGEASSGHETGVGTRGLDQAGFRLCRLHLQPGSRRHIRLGEFQGRPLENVPRRYAWDSQRRGFGVFRQGAGLGQVVVEQMERSVRRAADFVPGRQHIRPAAFVRHRQGWLGACDEALVLIGDHKCVVARGMREVVKITGLFDQAREKREIRLVKLGYIWFDCLFTVDIDLDCLADVATD